MANDGDDANLGTLEKPYATMARGQQAASPGDTVYLRAGTFRFVNSSAANGVALNKSGTSGKPITYAAYESEVPVFDFSGMTARARITGIRVTASWIHLKGMEVKLVPQNLTDQNESWGVYNDGGDNNVYELLNLHHNMGPGFFLGSGKDNLILNCDSHHNYDPKSKAGDGENADGFGCHPKAGDTGNVFRGVRAWWNTDDGFDSINALAGCTVEGSWAWLNGYLPDTMNEPNRNPDLPPGNGNGFKLGGFGIDGDGSPASPPVHTIRNSVAFLNVFAGFFANYHTGGNAYYNNTGFKNGADFNMLGLNMMNRSLLRNNLALGPTPTANLTGTDAKNNSWNLPVMANDADFVSTSTQGVDGPRQADGSLPNLGFVRLLPNSDLIDQGVDVGRPFEGKAPDLGAYELDNDTTPSGGTAGTPGAAGAVGAAGAGGASGGGNATAGSDAGGNVTAGAGNGGATVGAGAGSAGASGGSVGSGGNLTESPAVNDAGCGCRAVRGRATEGSSIWGFGLCWLLVLLRRGGWGGRKKGEQSRRSYVLVGSLGLSLSSLGASGCGAAAPGDAAPALAGSGSTLEGVAGGAEAAGLGAMASRGGMSGVPTAGGASGSGGAGTGGSNPAGAGGSNPGMGGNSDVPNHAGAGGSSTTCQAASVTSWTKDFADLIVDTDIAATYQAKGFEYTPGIAVLAVAKAYEKTKDERYERYVEKWVDVFFNADGVLDLGPRETEYTLDVIQPSVNVLAVYEWTKRDRYRTALAKLRGRFANLKKGVEGGFEHKPDRPQEMWADGMFMAYPFLTSYGRVFDDKSAFDLAAQQLTLFGEKATDSTTGLVFHAWDQDCNGSGVGAEQWTPLPGTCTSRVVWSRGMGWYMAALVEALGNLPADHPQRATLLDALRTSAAGLKTSQSSNGLWFQVIDRGTDPANWLETSGSGLLVYSLKTAVDHGYLDASYCAVAQDGWQGLQTRLVSGPRVEDAVEAMGVLASPSAYESKARVSNSAHALLAVVLAASVFE